ncbi:replication stress response regulator SDE2 [Ostrinia furnacalis]|uniref:replication stress response regulator SDE2 n=1 Tax=Ostrinia furnacalis TaxID=93504 RepID=UPI00103F119F|nr:replication stress response regulator SDE2 [Ostrinia furnacalis]
MGCQVYFENHLVSQLDCTNVSSLKQKISQEYAVPCEDLYATFQGKLIADDYELNDCENVVRVFTRLVGGKGGFGSMLRAIGAQIEKTTNREACRDLSGRRLRDINEEKRLRKWLEGQEDREREALERKQRKIEKLIAEPKIDVNLSPVYEKERQELPERVSAAVDAGWQAAGTSDGGLKRKLAEEKPKGKKKAKLWIDAELSDCSSLSEDEEEDEARSKDRQMVSTDSGNESDHTSDCSKL